MLRRVRWVCGGCEQQAANILRTWTDAGVTIHGDGSFAAYDGVVPATDEDRVPGSFVRHVELLPQSARCPQLRHRDIGLTRREQRRIFLAFGLIPDNGLLQVEVANNTFHTVRAGVSFFVISSTAASSR